MGESRKVGLAVKANELINNFNSGEVSALIESRSDLSKYAAGCKTLENAMPLVEGGAKKFPGTYYAGIAANGGPLGTPSSGKSRLVPFQFSTAQGAVLEIYAEGIRIWMNGGLIESGGSPVTVSTPYAEADLFDLDISTQSADVVYILHSSYPPASLNRISDTDWTYTPISLFGTDGIVNIGYGALGQPISSISKASPAVITLASATSVHPFAANQRVYINLCSGMVELNQGQFLVYSPGGSSGAWTFQLLPLITAGTGPVGSCNTSSGGASFGSDPSGHYAATGGTGSSFSVGVVGYRLSPGSWVISSVYVYAAGTGYTVGDEVSITVLTQTVNVYVDSLQGGGVIDSTNFLDYTGGGFAAAVNQLFNTGGNYPACATLYQQRLCLAGADDTPTQMNGSVQGDYTDFISDPNEDDYAIQFTLASRQVDRIRWMIGAPTSLLLGTASGVWAMFGSSGDSLSATNVTAAKQTTLGVGAVAPQQINDAVIWVTRSSRVVRLLIYNYITNQWEGPDLTRLNRQISIGPTEATSGIVQTSFQSEPYFIFWAVRADGQLIGLTYERDDQVFAWFRVVTDGVVESVATISQEGKEDQIWIVVKRTISGVDQRYVEYFMPQEIFSDLSNAFFVHCGLTYNGVSTTVITGLDYLEGKTVQVVADNARNPDCVVTGGKITLQYAASIVTVGLPIKTIVEPMNPIIGNPQLTSRGRKQKVSRATFSLFESMGGQYGTDQDHLYDMLYGTGSEGLTPTMFTGSVTFDFDGDWGDEDTISIVHEEPFPFCLRSVTPRIGIAEAG